MWFRNWPRPLTPIDIRSFLGLAGYYRSSVDGSSYIASPLTALTQKKMNVLVVGSLLKRFARVKIKAYLHSGIDFIGG